ncbi:DUF4111 domain-containing protein [Bacillus sp. BGMRC 2118]|nr:DUF4111 domain-containing protein [Bacillus sp. BGMRC 2118]
MNDKARKNGLNSLPKDVQPLIIEYIHQMKQVLNAKLIGVYLYGSIALEAFEVNSDIDFVTVLSAPMTHIEELLIGEIHRCLNEMYPSLVMDGGYVAREQLLKIEEVESLHMRINGSEIGEGSILNPVTGWILYHNGITVIGSEELLDEISVSKIKLKQYVNENMTQYWEPRLGYVKNISLDKTSASEIDEEIEWFILGISRQFYSLNEGDIVSKIAAGNYMITHFPHHQAILNEAIRIRLRKEENSYFTSEKERVNAAVSFIEELFNSCKNK